MKMKPAKPATRYAVVDAKGEIVSGLHQHRFPLEHLVNDHKAEPYRLVTFDLVERKEK